VIVYDFNKKSYVILQATVLFFTKYLQLCTKYYFMYIPVKYQAQKLPA